MKNTKKEAYKRFQELKALKEVKTKKEFKPHKRTDEKFMDGLEREYERVRNIYYSLEPNSSKVPVYLLKDF